jgi:hypothetical protein
MVIKRKNSYPLRKNVLKGIVSHRSTTSVLNRGNKRERLTSLYEAKIEFLKEQVKQSKRLQQKAVGNRREKLRNAQKEYELQLIEMKKLLKNID